MTGRPRRRASQRTGALALVLLGLLVLGASTARADTAQDDWADELGLEVAVGVGGQDVADAWRPVTVTLAPRTPFGGRVLVAGTRPGGMVLQSRDVEVAAGGAQRHHLLVPPETQLRVQVVEEGSERVATVAPRGDRVDGVLLGVLGRSDPAGVPPTTLPATDQRVTVVGVDHALLDLGPLALQSLDTLVVDQADLAGLSPTQRDTLARATAHGATLVVVGATDADLGLPWRAFTSRDGPGLVTAPGAWGATTAAIAGDPAPAPETDVVAVAAGRGRLVATSHGLGSDALGSAAVWEHLAQPRAGADGAARRAAEQLPNQVEQAFGHVVGEPPSVGWLATFFLAYVLVAGPVVGVVLSRRRRPEIAWVVLPVVTALFVGGAFVGATGSRPRVGAAATVDTWIDGLGTTHAVSGVRAPQAGQRTVVLPGAGWAVTGATWEGSTQVEPADDTAVTLSLPGQSFGAVVAQRALDAPPPLDVEVALFRDEARVEVTNTTDQALDDVTLHLATDTQPLADTLPAGETLVETVALPATLPAQIDPFAAGDGGAFAIDPGPEALAGVVRWGALDGSPGTIWVTATTPTSAQVQAVDGSPPVDHGRLVAVGSTPSLTDDATVPLEVRRDVVASSVDVSAEAPLTLAGLGPATLRFRLPAEGVVTDLVFSLDRGCCLDVAPQPDGFQEPTCGQLEIRDGATGDVLQVRDACGITPPCPAEATVCSWQDDPGAVVEGEVCFDDGACHPMTWTRPEAPPPHDGPAPAAGVAGMQVWDHPARRWVDHGEVAAEVGGQPSRWIGPLGDVWVRATGEFGPLDLAPQGVAAELEGGR